MVAAALVPAALLLLLARPAEAAVATNALFSDGMILQTQLEAPLSPLTTLHGTAAPGEKVTLTGSASALAVLSISGKNGRQDRVSSFKTYDLEFIANGGALSANGSEHAPWGAPCVTKGGRFVRPLLPPHPPPIHRYTPTLINHES